MKNRKRNDRAMVMIDGSGVRVVSAPRGKALRLGKKSKKQRGKR